MKFCMLYSYRYEYGNLIECITTDIVLKAILYNQLPYGTHPEPHIFSVISVISSKLYDQLVQ